MATIQEKLAESLEVLKTIQDNNRMPIVRSSELSRTHLTRLVKSGFLTEVIKGWYITTSPTTTQGDTTPWYTSYWNFIAVYANSRFGNNWCLSPETSLAIHSGNWAVPTQIVIRSPKGSNNVIQLLHDAVIENFPILPHKEINVESFISEVEKRYTQDAYHSLSIEGYRVTTVIIERVKSGNWGPDKDDYDKEQKNAMAARGYWLAFQAVKESIKKILNGANAGEVAETDLSKWHYELFEPAFRLVY